MRDEDDHEVWLKKPTDAQETYAKTPLPAQTPPVPALIPVR
jgi:hypothetical protein